MGFVLSTSWWLGWKTSSAWLEGLEGPRRSVPSTRDYPTVTSQHTTHGRPWLFWRDYQQHHYIWWSIGLEKKKWCTRPRTLRTSVCSPFIIRHEPPGWHPDTPWRWSNASGMGLEAMSRYTTSQLCLLQFPRKLEVLMIHQIRPQLSSLCSSCGEIWSHDFLPFFLPKLCPIQDHQSEVPMLAFKSFKTEPSGFVQYKWPFSSSMRVKKGEKALYLLGFTWI